MSVNPWYIPGSLRNLAAAEGEVKGYCFAYRVHDWRTFYFVIHRMVLFLDGVEVLKPNLRLKYKGEIARAENLPETGWMALRGQLVEVTADHPDGLPTGRHQVRLEAVFGGAFDQGAPGRPQVLCDFTAESR